MTAPCEGICRDFEHKNICADQASKYRCYLRGSGASGFYVHALCLRLLWDACAFIRLLSSLLRSTREAHNKTRVNERQVLEFFMVAGHTVTKWLSMKR